MIKASIVLALAGAAVLSASLGGVDLPLYLPISTFALAGLLYASLGIPKFLRIFQVMLGVAHLVLLALILAAVGGLITGDYLAYVPPPSSPLGATAFAAIIYGLSFVPVVRTICRITDIYLESRVDTVIRVPLIGRLRAQEGTIGSIFVGILIAINLGQVALSVRLNFFQRDLFNALQAKDAGAFWYQLFVVFTPIAAVFVLVALMELFLQNVLIIRWRRYLNSHYVGEWLGEGAHYRMQIIGGPADNPDQRISEDLRKFVENTYSLSIGLMNQAATLVSFVAILWAVSRTFTFPGTDTPAPGLLVWICIVYAALGTIATHFIGRPLIGLNFQQERLEADYRFSLVRLREYTEQVALLGGERAEEAGLHRRFGRIVDNYMQIIYRMLKLNSFTATYFQANVVVPYIITAPYYFLDKITLGQMQQTVGAFSRVELALTYFIQIYTTLADYKAVLDRLTSFESAIAAAQRVGGESAIEHPASAAPELGLRNLHLTLPDGRTLLNADNLAFRRGERTLLTGPSGSGKSTLFRAIAGILAVRGGQGRPARRRLDAAPAAAALHPDRDFARRRRLSGRGRSLHGCGDLRRASEREAAADRRPARRGADSGARPSPSGNSSASPSRGRSSRSRTGCFSTRPRPPSTSGQRRRLQGRPREAAAHDDRLDRPPLDLACDARPPRRHEARRRRPLHAGRRARAGAGKVGRERLKRLLEAQFAAGLGLDDQGRALLLPFRGGAQGDEEGLLDRHRLFRALLVRQREGADREGLLTQGIGRRRIVVAAAEAGRAILLVQHEARTVAAEGLSVEADGDPGRADRERLFLLWRGRRLLLRRRPAGPPALGFGRAGTSGDGGQERRRAERKHGSPHRNANSGRTIKGGRAGCEGGPEGPRPTALTTPGERVDCIQPTGSIQDACRPSQRHPRGPRRSDPARDPRPPRPRRDHGHGDRRAVRDEPQRRLEAPAGARARRARRPRPQRPMASVPARRRADAEASEWLDGYRRFWNEGRDRLAELPRDG